MKQLLLLFTFCTLFLVSCTNTDNATNSVNESEFDKPSFTSDPILMDLLDNHMKNMVGLISQSNTVVDLPLQTYCYNADGSVTYRMDVETALDGLLTKYMVFEPDDVSGCFIDDQGCDLVSCCEGEKECSGVCDFTQTQPSYCACITGTTYERGICDFGRSLTELDNQMVTCGEQALLSIAIAPRSFMSVELLEL